MKTLLESKLNQLKKLLMANNVDIKYGHFTVDEFVAVLKKIKIRIKAEKQQVLMKSPTKYGKQNNMIALFRLCNAV